jgi:hypothetical protein
VPQELHGRVFALQKGLTSLAFAASFAGASALIAGMGVQRTFMLAAAGMLAVVLVAGPRLRAAWPAPAGGAAAAPTAS